MAGFGGAGENRTHDRGFADLGLTTWLPRPHSRLKQLLKRKALARAGLRESGAPPLQILNRLAQLRAFLLRLHYSNQKGVLLKGSNPQMQTKPPCRRFVPVLCVDPCRPK
jgi:hypothetical protein